MARRRKYDEAFVARAMELLKTHRQFEAARELGVSRSTVHYLMQVSKWDRAGISRGRPMKDLVLETREPSPPRRFSWQVST